MLSRGALLAECLVKNSAPKVNSKWFFWLIMEMCAKVNMREKKTKVCCHVSRINSPIDPKCTTFIQSTRRKKGVLIKSGCVAIEYSVNYATAENSGFDWFSVISFIKWKSEEKVKTKKNSQHSKVLRKQYDISLIIHFSAGLRCHCYCCCTSRIFLLTHNCCCCFSVLLWLSAMCVTISWCQYRCARI